MRRRNPLRVLKKTMRAGGCELAIFIRLGRELGLGHLVVPCSSDRAGHLECGRTRSDRAGSVGGVDNLGETGVCGERTNPDAASSQPPSPLPHPAGCSGFICWHLLYPTKPVPPSLLQTSRATVSLSEAGGPFSSPPPSLPPFFPGVNGPSTHFFARLLATAAFAPIQFVRSSVSLRMSFICSLNMCTWSLKRKVGVAQQKQSWRIEDEIETAAL